MSVLKLNYPVITLDGTELLAAGKELSEETLRELISSNSSSYEINSLADHGSIKQDLVSFLKRPPYNMVFADQGQVAELLKLMEGVNLVSPVLQSLDHFRKNDFYTYRHILMVFALSTLVAGDLIEDYQDRIREAATGPTHDIGKLCISPDILRKAAPLTRAEHHNLEHHAAAGYVLLSYYFKDSKTLPVAVAKEHHERTDGSGYPAGLKLNDRMVEIVAVSDIYDALISPRPYRPVAYDNRTAFEELTTMAETGKIGWEVVKALIAHSRRDKPHFSECEVSAEKRGAPPPGNVYGIIADEQDPDQSPENK
ncbi:MAG TPA: hypothetical protein ENG80_01375 [Nitrospirae bacterium]|nr:cyclic di-GMP phosphodiesterase response regulator RpfG [bacterium BMS3Bbin08]HDH00444.1 hypothetical protein [Nitrospirota bacterium]